MKSRKIMVSLYILIPFIFGGISLIGAIVAHYLTASYLRAAGNIGIIAWWLVAIVLLTLTCSFLIVFLVLKPVMKFLKASEKMPLMRTDRKESAGAVKTNPEYYGLVFDRATDILTKMEAKEQFRQIVGQSAVMRNLFGQLLKVAPTDATVLLLGESGTGKELVATAIYEHSHRKEMPFIKINCVAIPEGLLESELFGHEKGAFTGALAQKKGKFELADGGAIFLDEIGDMPLPTQAKLLRVLQEQEFERVGGVKPIKVDVRFIAATNKDLEGLVKSGEFRSDLYFRLNVFPVHIPPLRARREDIPLLSQHFLLGTSVTEISARAMQLLIGYPWPGNVRELQNVIARAAVLADRAVIEDFHLPAGMKPDMNGQGISLSAGAALDDRLAAFEKGSIIEALNRTAGVQARAADLLGINQRSLWHRIKKHGIDVGSLKKGSPT
ncbi:MAG: sigma-54 dependent transcriptional regulator [Smithellaceae bacterium]|nr:sigma-54 dependent transcriptional regulator [Smithellaceae bacterium]